MLEPQQLVRRSFSFVDLPRRSGDSEAVVGVHVPRGTPPPEGWPMLIVLHGSGERGCDGDRALVDARSWVSQPDEPGRIVVVPQCPTEERWVDVDWKQGTYEFEQVAQSRILSRFLTWLELFEAQQPVDPGQRLLTGLSMGGYGTWDLGLRHPERFAALLPICGGGDPTEAKRLRDLPVHAVHGTLDDAVPVEASRAMVRALRDVAAPVKYTEWPEMGHAVWARAYAEPQIRRWFLGQKRGI